MKVGIVVPCFNEASRWNRSYWEELLRRSDVSWTLVNDGSRDETEALLSSYRSAQVECLSLPSNQGKGEAVRQGLQQLCDSDAEWVGFMDSDGAFSRDEVSRFLELLGAAEPETKAVWSSRVRMRGRRINRQPSRHFIGRSIATALSIKFPGLPYDSQSGLKFFRNSTQLRDALRNRFRTKWLFDVELFARLDVLYAQDPVWLWEEPVLSWQHIGGSKISARESLRVPREVAYLLTLGASR